MPTSRWFARDLAHAESIVERVLDGCGDDSIQRSFRMCVTLCRHRALTAAERANTPAWFQACRPVHIAGPPLKLLWSRGVPDELETMRPCLNPSKRDLPGHPGAYLFNLCERCEPCLTNERVRLHIDSRIAANGGRPLLETR